MTFSRPAWGLVTATLFLVAASSARAQVCHGTPRRGGVAYEYAKLSVGNSHGVSGALAGGRTALGVTLRLREITSQRSGQEANVRFSMLFPASRLQICPGLGFGYQRDQTDDAQLALTTTRLAARAGAGVGLEQHVYKGVNVIPFVVVQYEFALKHFKLNAPGNQSESADTLSHVDIEYGLIGRYRFVYGGIAANRSSATEGVRPLAARYVVGLTFGSAGQTRGAGK